MPYQLEWEGETGLVFRFTGIVTSEELIATNTEVIQDPRLASLRYQIADCSCIDGIDVTGDAVRELARLDEVASRINPDVVIAIISSELIVRGLTNMYALNHEAVGGTWETEIFDDEISARDWLKNKA